MFVYSYKLYTVNLRFYLSAAVLTAYFIEKETDSSEDQKK